VFTHVSHPVQVLLLTIILTNVSLPSDFLRCLEAVNIRFCKLCPCCNIKFLKSNRSNNSYFPNFRSANQAIKLSCRVYAQEHLFKFRPELLQARLNFLFLNVPQSYIQNPYCIRGLLWRVTNRAFNIHECFEGTSQKSGICEHMHWSLPGYYCKCSRSTCLKVGSEPISSQIIKKGEKFEEIVLIQFWSGGFAGI
jgi:hypothetical protein